MSTLYPSRREAGRVLSFNIAAAVTIATFALLFLGVALPDARKDKGLSFTTEFVNGKAIHQQQHIDSHVTKLEALFINSLEALAVSCLAGLGTLILCSVLRRLGLRRHRHHHHHHYHRHRNVEAGSS